MKILSIEFKNINSLKGEHRIDFTRDEFTQSPLFAITGPTGSGKTTILDVISLALFGQVPRLGKISKSTIEEKGAILTRNQKEAYAKITYDCKKGTFDSVWSISTARTGNLRDFEMELYRVEPMERLGLKKSEVPAKNEELIGLNYSQFVKSVVLAQGEFSEFLKSSPRDRSELLENITGTGIYRELGILAFQKYAEVEREIKDQEVLLENEKTRVLEEEEKNKIAQELEKRIEEKKKLDDKISDTKKQIELKQETQALEKNISDKKKSLEEVRLKSKEYHKLHSERLVKHNQISRYSKELHLWKTSKSGLKKINEEQARFTNLKSTLLKKKEEAIQNIKTFIREELTAEEVEDKLKAFQTKVARLYQERKDLGSKYLAQINLLKSELKNFELDSVSNLIEQPNLWKQLKTDVEQTKQRFQEIFSQGLPINPGEKIEAKEKELENFQQAKSVVQELSYLSNQENELHNKVKKLKNEIEPLPELVKTKETTYQFEEKNLEILELRKEKQFLEASLESHRHKLENGEPCPLCGALEHPYADNKPKRISDLDKQFKEKKREVERLKNELSKKTNRLELLQKQLSELEVESENIKIKKERFFEQNKARFGEYLGENIEDLEMKIQNTRRRIIALKDFEKFFAKQKSLEQAEPIYKEILKITAEGKQKAREIGTLYKGKSVETLNSEVSSLDKNWQGILHEINSAKNRLKEIGDKLKQEKDVLLQVEKPLKNNLNQLGFAEISKAFTALLPIDEVEKIQTKIQDYKDQFNSISTEIRTHNERHNSLIKKLKTDKQLDALHTELQSFHDKQSELESEIRTVERKLKNNADSLKEIERLKQLIDKKEKNNFRWKSLKDLIGDSKGNRFNQFAQDLTLRQLLNLANKRLQSINNRYELVMIPNQEKNKDNLVVADKDMGGQQRAVHTLSGGETFLMSLGLALALSDLASQNININSLFIDEGFGTLDPETLDQTLDTLERLQASSSKIIGIISHVDALKERIATQIQLEKSGQGYSLLKITSA